MDCAASSPRWVEPKNGVTRDVDKSLVLWSSFRLKMTVVGPGAHGMIAEETSFLDEGKNIFTYKFPTVSVCEWSEYSPARPLHFP